MNDGFTNSIVCGLSHDVTVVGIRKGIIRFFLNASITICKHHVAAFTHGSRTDATCRLASKTISKGHTVHVVEPDLVSQIIIFFFIYGRHHNTPINRF